MTSHSVIQAELFDAPATVVDVDYFRWRELCEKLHIDVHTTWIEITDIRFEIKGILYKPSAHAIAAVRSMRKKIKHVGLRRWLARRSYYFAGLRPHDGKEWPTWEFR